MTRARNACVCSRREGARFHCGEPDLTIEIFLMDGPLAGFGALELVDPPTRPAQLSHASGRRWAPGPETGSTALMDRIRPYSSGQDAETHYSQ